MRVVFRLLLVTVLVAALPAQAGAAPEAPPPAAIRIEVTASPDGERLTFRCRHARLDRIVEAAARASDVALEVDTDLAYQRLHLFADEWDVARLRQVLASMTGGEWKRTDDTWRLTASAAYRARMDRLRRDDPPPPAAVDDTAEHLRTLTTLAALASDPEALHQLALTNPEAARQLAQPAARATLAYLATLPAWQLLMIATPQGATLAKNKMPPEFRAVFLDAMRAGDDRLQRIPADATDLKSLQIAVQRTGDLFVFYQLERAGNGGVASGLGISLRARPSREAIRSVFDAPLPGPAPGEPPVMVEPSMVVELMSSSISWRVDPHAAALGRLQELYGISVVSHIRFTKIELANNSLDRRMAQRILGQERPLPVGVVMRAWATMYELEYAYEDDVHVFRNPKQHWEPEYSHSDGLLRRIEAVPMTEAVPLTTLADLLAPTQNARRAEGLSVWREWAEPLMHSRAKIQFFGALDEAQREQAAKREGLPLVLLSGDLQVQFWQAFGLAAAIPPPAVQRRVVLRTLRPPVQASVRAEWLWFEIRE